MTDVEIMIVRIDHFYDRAKYVSIVRAWMQELKIVNGRLIAMGSDLHLLFIVATELQNSKLLNFYRTRDIDVNSRGELCIDRFIDVLGRRKVATCSCKGFLEMNVLSPMLLQKLLVHEWQVEQEWLDAALTTKRTKSFLEWKEAAKATRKERRKKEGKEKYEVKKMKLEEAQKDDKETSVESTAELVNSETESGTGGDNSEGQTVGMSIEKQLMKRKPKQVSSRSQRKKRSKLMNI
ncbi:uncharacterized protein PHALS_00923 [Plasmopara halstedii]|uniref:Uncharacterized protein n=1 Tax=Plasmopara halstedii TaxID=4781 RepID=A0A0P1ATI4_PLAHL|nr:uncharacterized protein PHALS_00923 [Plasmopara halstedii]CEG44572.1 hypothetical protein PHALS_00923 [Plasmopara halstedii]|eukprot:XP_024580941.1 hypothetical protein PHALS_00923 [Plasmopara halstedii]